MRRPGAALPVSAATDQPLYREHSYADGALLNVTKMLRRRRRPSSDRFDDAQLTAAAAAVIVAAASDEAHDSVLAGQVGAKRGH